MVIPVNFIVGAAVGAVSTYVYKDNKTREWLSDTGSKIKDKSSSLISSFKKKTDDTDVDTQNLETVEKETAEKQKDVKAATAEAVEKESTEEQKDVKATEATK